MRRFIPVGESADALIRINGYPLKNLALVTEVDVIEIGDCLDLRSGICFLSNIVFAERDEILRLVERKWSQQHRVQDTKDRGIGANSECKSQNDNGGKERLL